MRRTLCRLALGLLLLTAPWASARAQHPFDRPADRPSDDLLARPALQAVVDAQVERDAGALVAYLADPDPAVRARAAFALASVQDSTAVPALLAALADSNAVVRADAAFALGQTPGRVPAPALLDALARSTDPAVQRRLVEALGKKGDAASLASLVSWAWKDTLHVEAALAVGRYALRDIHAPEAVDYLVKNLFDDDPQARHYAAYYFARARDTTAWAPRADTVRVLLDALAPDDPAAMHLVRGLGRLADPADTPRLLHWLRTAEDWRTRVNAVGALAARTDDQGVRAALYDHLVDPSVHVAVAAAEALNDGKAWSETDVDLVKQWVQYNGYAWRITGPLLEGLAQQNATAFVFNELERRRNSRNPLSYAHGLPALAHLPFADAFNDLVNAAHSPDVRVAYAALRILAARWPDDRADPATIAPYFDVFADGLRRKDQATVAASAPALTDSLFRPLGATPLLYEVFLELQTPEDLDALTSIVRALGRTGDPAADSLLRQATAHPHPAVAAAAYDALETLTGEPAPARPDTLPPERTVDWAYLRKLGPHPQFVLDTARGAVTLVLDAEEAPLTTQTIAQFARAGHFDGVPFHRVVPNFVIQGGDYARGDGFGGPLFSIRSEFTRLAYTRGTLGMASSGKDTEGSQFFITHSMQPHLDGRYTAFGYVLTGLNAVDTLYEDDRVLKATIIPDGE